MKLAIALVLLGLSAAVVQAVPPAKTKAHHTEARFNGKNTRESTQRHGSACRFIENPHSAWAKREKQQARRAPGPSYQTHPDSARYQEIQKALADKGYFKGETERTVGQRFGGCPEAVPGGPKPGVRWKDQRPHFVWARPRPQA